MDLSAPEIRVLGCLLEKQRTTPEAYPLSLNALRLACNQATNRDPVVAYDEAIVRDALHRLSRRRWARLASGPGSRAPKYRHLLDDALGLPADELAVLCVLMLRGAQTPGELKQRTERLHPLGDLSSVIATLERLIDRELAVRLPRRPGQKEERYAHLLDDAAGEPAEGPAPAAAPAPPIHDDHEAAPAAVAPAPAPAPDPRVGRLEDELAALRADLDALRATVDALRADLGA
ncbi:MAG TPA: YceH family protein [Solirubrobacteraceae bacterium]|nr:YceH family protein [Solirubrobacteraceae bacterium]